MKKILKSEKGQTSVEYIFMILVVVIVSISVFKKIHEYVISNPDSFINRYTAAFNASFGGAGDGGSFNYKRFRLLR